MRKKSVFQQCREQEEKKGGTPVAVVLTEFTKTALFSPRLPIPPRNELIEYPIDVIEKKFGFNWLDGISGPELFIKNVIQPSLKGAKLIEHTGKVVVPWGFISKGLSTHSKNLVLAKINKQIGYGIFYVGPTIKKVNSEIIAQYTGELAETNQRGSAIYTNLAFDSRYFSPTTEGLGSASQ